MNSKWLFGLKSVKEKKTREILVNESKEVIYLLQSMMERDYEKLIIKAQQNENFSKPAWSEEQAYLLGMQKQLNNYIKLLKV